MFINYYFPSMYYKNRRKFLPRQQNGILSICPYYHYNTVLSKPYV